MFAIEILASPERQLGGWLGLRIAMTVV